MSLPVFATHRLGLPLPGSPLAFLHPQLPCWLMPTSLWRGEGWMQLRLLMALQVEVESTWISWVMCTNIMWSWPVGTNIGLISSKSNHLPSSPTSTTHAPPSKDVGWVWNRSSTPLKQHGCQPRLPLPSHSALPRHSTLSIKNASPGLLPPSSLPHHLMLSVEDASPSLPLPLHPPLCHITWRWASRMPLVCHHPPLCHITWRWALRMPPPVCHCPHTLYFAADRPVM